jgi:hypothetical protein
MKPKARYVITARGKWLVKKGIMALVAVIGFGVVLFTIAAIMVVIDVWRAKPHTSTSGPVTDAAASPTSPPEAEVTSASPVSEKMASIQSGSRTPPPEMVERFQTALTRLNAYCPDSQERVGDFLVSGQRQLAAKGISLIVLAESVATMLDTAKSNGGIPQMNSCAEPVALVVTMLQAK